MRSLPRPRRYLRQPWLTFVRPCLRWSDSRDAYVLRVVGRRYGPVLRLDERRRRAGVYAGPERRRER